MRGVIGLLMAITEIFALLTILTILDERAVFSDDATMILGALGGIIIGWTIIDQARAIV